MSVNGASLPADGMSPIKRTVYLVLGWIFVAIGIVGALLCPLSSLIVLWPLLGVFDLEPAQRGLLLLYAALPPAVMNYILADRYGQDPGLVSAIVVGGNLASLAFVPLALYLGL